ncbi:MAG: hypothetical protein IPI73_26445 [Betaproteobacteria bacterium]|nr:hypothetical protein [Betaproteobacteria bacterium]
MDTALTIRATSLAGQGGAAENQASRGGFDPDAKKGHWAIPGRALEELGLDLSELSVHRKLDYLLEHAHISIVEGEEWPHFAQWNITSSDGQPLSDLWAYPPYTEGTLFGPVPVSTTTFDGWAQACGRTGYPTQKPIGLLPRIISASSNEGDVECSIRSAAVVLPSMPPKTSARYREKAAMGFFVTLTDPTKYMVTEGVGTGYYTSPFTGAKFPKLQVLTIEGLLSGKERAEYPRMDAGGLTFKKAKKEEPAPVQKKLI